ncbi:hypothetical protein [Natrinema sp. J7-2]|uniref:hypothetical protein n=1 Tax=Natrinema sp. (strain J7-2) TaxID=406552 RepID=UPI00026D5288|nr:hypothetical protein [Natrinema sp. J7-2]AFO55369.1 hypothetical protein NJ7G_0115 [Natrinema sp. J7-2]
MTVPRRLRTLVIVGVYALFIFIPGFGLVAEPTDVLVVLPIGCGSLLLVHAVTTNQLDELVYAIMGLYAALLLTSVSLSLMSVIAPNVVPSDLVGTTGPVGVTTVLVGGYLLAMREHGLQTVPPRHGN